MTTWTKCVNADSYDALLPPRCKVIGVGDIPSACTVCTEKWQLAQRSRINKANAGRKFKPGKSNPAEYNGPDNTFELRSK